MDCQLLKEITVEEAESPVSEGVLKKHINENNRSTVHKQQQKPKTESQAKCETALGQTAQEPWCTMVLTGSARTEVIGTGLFRDSFG